VLLTSAAQEKASSYRDDEVQRATTDINLRHAQMHRSDASRELRLHEPNVHIESEVHVARAKAMLNIVDDSTHEPEHRVVGKTIPTRKEPPAFTKPLQNVRVKEGQAIKSVAVISCLCFVIHVCTIKHDTCTSLFTVNGRKERYK